MSDTLDFSNAFEHIIKMGMHNPNHVKQKAMKKYKFITILQDSGEVFNKKPVYRIFNNRNKVSQLGIISYYTPWKEYVFSSQPECVFNNSCLRDVLDFIENVIPTLQ